MKKFSTDQKSKYQRSRKRFHSLLLELRSQEPSRRLAIKVNGVFSSLNGGVQMKFTSDDYDTLSAILEPAVNQSLNQLSKVENQITLIKKGLK